MGAWFWAMIALAGILCVGLVGSALRMYQKG